MMINDGTKRLVVVAVGVSVISYDAVYQQLTRSSMHPARIENERFCAFSGLFWDILQHNGDVG